MNQPDPTTNRTTAPAGDEDCERCEGSGLDPDAYFKNGDTYTHAPCSECQPEDDETAQQRAAEQARIRDRRDRYAAPLYALMRQNGWDGERTEPVVREMDLVLDAVLAVADAEQAGLRSAFNAQLDLFADTYDRHTKQIAELRRAAVPAAEEQPEVVAPTLLGAAELEEKLSTNVPRLTGAALTADEAVEEQPENETPDACDHESQVISHQGALFWACMKCGTNLGRADGEQQPAPPAVVPQPEEA